MTHQPTSSALLELAERYEREGTRIAKRALHQFDGVIRADAATAAHCLTIAACLKARATGAEE